MSRPCGVNSVLFSGSGQSVGMEALRIIALGKELDEKIGTSKAVKVP